MVRLNLRFSVYREPKGHHPRRRYRGAQRRPRADRAPFRGRGLRIAPHPGRQGAQFPLPGSGSDGRKDLPGEHGFRFFPRFYRHVTDTMSRIPCGTGGNVADNLVDTTRCQLARFGRHAVDLTARFPRTINDVRVVLDDVGRRLFGGDLELSHDELAFFGSKVWQIVTSCRERRMTEYEKIGWWDFIEAEHRSPAYQKLLGHGITRSLVAAKAVARAPRPSATSSSSCSSTSSRPGPSTDRVLNGPTNDVWIDPWLDTSSRGASAITSARRSRR